MIQFGVYHDGNAVYDKRSLLYVDDVSLQIDAQPVPVDQLAAYYPFNGDAHDASGNGNDGVVTGATLTTDRFGNPASAYQFNGNNDYIRAEYSRSLSFRQDMTAAAWIKTTDDAGGIAQEHNGTTDGNFIFDVSYGGRFRFGRSALLVSSEYNSQYVNDNRWHLVVGVFDHTHAQVRQYVDGLLVLTYTDFTALPDNHIPLIIGDENNHLYAFNGVIDDVRFYSRALSDAEIAALWIAQQ
jgi:Concanavalin A-like lectin/glucanases superfamily